VAAVGNNLCTVVPYMCFYVKVLVELILPLPPLGHIWDVILVWRKGNIEKTVSVLHYCVSV